MKRALTSLLLQFLAALALTLAALLLRPIDWLHGVCVWLLLPAIALASAFLLVKKGLNPYISWIMPPLAMAALPLAVLGYLTDGGALMLTVFVGILGAAAGDTHNRFTQKGRK